MVKQSRGLGKGLQALIPKLEKDDEIVNASLGNVTEVQVDLIYPNPMQPRNDFSEEKLKELAESIKEYGIVQPILIRKKENKFELVAGERRWRAAQFLKLEKIPAIIKEIEDEKIAEIALIENIQREDLNPIDEAIAYKRLLNEFNITQEELSKRVGKSRPFIANMVRVLNLPPKIQNMVSAGELSMGHARALLSIDDRTLQVVIAEKILRNQLSVRQTEEVVKSVLQDEELKDHDKKKIINIDPIINQAEDRLKKLLGTKVKIKDSGGKGKIEIEYYNDSDFNRILEMVLPGEEF